MKYELTTFELGTLLKKISDNNTLSIMCKLNLSGGWITLNGKADILEIPKDDKIIAGNNFISIKVSDNNNNGNVIKIIGAKNSKFTIDISPTKFKEIKTSSLNLDMIKESNCECKLRIDENIIFTINNSSDEIEKLITSML